MDSRPLAALLVAVALLASLPVVGFATGAPADSSPAANYSLEELRTGGESIAGAAPSTRWISTGESVFVDYEHSNPLRKRQGDEWQAKQLLTADSTVQMNELRLHSKGTKSSGKRNLTVKIAYWNVGKRTKEVDNETVTERYAENVSVSTHDVTFTEAFGRATIRLRPHYDQPKQATMWIVGNEETARWRFVHSSVETSQAVDISSYADLLLWFFSEIFIWTVLGAFGLLIPIQAMKRRAGEGPQKGMIWWLIVTFLVTGIVLAIAYESVAEAFVHVPKLLALLTVVILGIPVLESRRDVSKWLFIRPELTKATTATGDDAKDATRFELDSRRITRMPNGRLAVVESGIMKFIARLFGGAAYLENQDRVDTEVRASGKSRYEQIVFTRSSAGSALEYEPEGWGIRWPGLSGLLPLGILTLALGSVGSAYFGGWALAAAAVPLMTIRPHAGSARVEPASGHQRAAYVTMLYGLINDQHAETIEEMRKELMESKAQNQKQIKHAIEQADHSLVRGAVSEGVPDDVQGPSVENVPDGPGENGSDPGKENLRNRIESMFSGGSDDA